MTWVKIENTLPDHERAIQAGDRAMWMWVAGLCWCSRHLSDGRIPRDVVPRLTSASDAFDLAARLVEVGLWKTSKAGYVVKNYGKFQRTKAQVEAEKSATRTRVAKHRKKRSGNAVTNAHVTLSDTDTDKRQIREDLSPLSVVQEGPPPDWLKERMLTLTRPLKVSDDDAHRCIDRLRFENVADITIDEVVGFALGRAESGQLHNPVGFVTTVARNWHVQRVGTGR